MSFYPYTQSLCLSISFSHFPLSFSFLFLWVSHSLTLSPAHSLTQYLAHYLSPSLPLSHWNKVGTRYFFSFPFSWDQATFKSESSYSSLEKRFTLNKNNRKKTHLKPKIFQKTNFTSDHDAKLNPVAADGRSRLRPTPELLRGGDWRPQVPYSQLYCLRGSNKFECLFLAGLLRVRPELTLVKHQSGTLL